jgi:hypothetical protein
VSIPSHLNRRYISNHSEGDKQGGGEGEFDKDKLIEAIQKLPKETLPGVPEWAKTARQNLIEGKTFISDEEATALGLAFTQKSIELKMHILEVIDTGSWLMVSLVSAPAELKMERRPKRLMLTHRHFQFPRNSILDGRAETDN